MRTPPAWLHRAHRQMAAQPALTLVGCALLLALLVWACLRVPTEQDVGALLPDGPGSPREAAQLLGEFGALNTLLLDLEVPGASRDELAARGAQLAAQLRGSGAFAEVYTGPSLRELIALGQVLFPRRLLLLPDPAAELERRLAPERLAQSLGALKAQLASPQAFATKGELLRDPLGLNADLLAAFARMAGDVEPHGGQLLSRDGHHLLLVTTPRAPALDTRASEALLVQLAQVAAGLAPGPAGPAALQVVGGPRFATESAAAVKHDIVLTVVTSVLFLLAIFLVRFRSVKLLALSSLPIALGMAGGVAAVALVQGRVHALSLAFGSVLIGVAIDYPLHLLNAASGESGDRLEGLARALEELWRPLWLGFGTTVFGFSALFASHFPGLRELALFGGAGVLVAFLATLVVLPPLCAAWGPVRLSGVPAWMPRLRARALPPRLVGVLTLALLAGGVLGARGIHFDGDLRSLDAQRPETLAEYQQVLGRFGLQDDQALIVARGADVQQALAVNDAVLSVLGTHGLREGVAGVGTFLPSRATQEQRAAQLRGVDVEQARSRLAEAAGRAGFQPAAFEGFWAELESVRSGRTAPLAPEQLASTSLGPLLSRLLRCSPAGCLAVTSLPLTDAVQAQRLAHALPAGAVLLDARALAADTVSELPRQLLLLCGLGLLLNVGLLTFAYRSLRLALLACLPCVLGLLGTLAVLALLHIPLNLISASALGLVLGCGVDYGIFILQEVSGERPASQVESTGVLLAALTTLAGFGTLVLASHRALQSLGAAVGLGILFCAAAAIFLLPAVYRAQAQRAPAPQPEGAP